MGFSAIPFSLHLSPRQKRIALGLATFLAAGILGLAALAPVLIFLRSQAPYWGADAMSLQSISMVSPAEGWAVGHISGSPNSLLIHFAHGQWTILPKPAGLDDTSEFANVAMVAATDGWAWASMPIPEGDRYHSFRPGGVLLHYDGTSWKVATSVLPIAIGFDPSALLMLSSRDGWATGEDKTLHFDGTSWREVTALSDHQWGGGSSISATSSNDIWIARYTGDIVHYDGASWTEQRVTVPFGQQLPGPLLLRGIAMTSATEGFAVGGIGNSSQGLILHLIAGRWDVEQTVDELLYGIAVTSTTEGWAVGAAGGVYHYASGEWTRASSGVSVPLYAITSPILGTETWAVGLNGTLLRYHESRWQQETNVVWSQEAQDAWK